MPQSREQYAIPPPQLRSLPIVGDSRRFPVNRIFCVGRNYSEHAREMGHDPSRELPFFFMKPPSAIVTDGGSFPYPPLSTNVQHEVELVVALACGGSDIKPDKALDHVFGYAVGLDMTRRDLQAEAKATGRPWDTGKAFDGSALCGEVAPVAHVGHPTKGAVTLGVNGQQRQAGDLGDLIWNIPETISYLSTLFTLEAGDLIFTGTPAGVGAVKRGDQLIGAVAGVGQLFASVV